jgi:prepilin-type N-terminal cleavage/methylation domain-containing protein
MRAPQHGDEAGFTLIEIIIVVAVIAILAGIAVPSYVHSRASANEGAVVATLRAIATGEFKFKAMAHVDRNGDGGAEYGTMREMTGGEALRGSGGDRLLPNLLPLSLDGLDAQGRFQKHGYYFKLWLPDAAGTGLPETPATLPNVDPVAGESYWTMLAWPVSANHSGRATYFVNQQGEILKCVGTPYSAATEPPAGAALLGVPATSINSNSLAIETLGADGNRWNPVH